MDRTPFKTHPSLSFIIAVFEHLRYAPLMLPVFFCVCGSDQNLLTFLDGWRRPQREKAPNSLFRETLITAHASSHAKPFMLLKSMKAESVSIVTIHILNQIKIEFGLMVWLSFTGNKATKYVGNDTFSDGDAIINEVLWTISQVTGLDFRPVGLYLSSKYRQVEQAVKTLWKWLFFPFFEVFFAFSL